MAICANFEPGNVSNRKSYNEKLQDSWDSDVGHHHVSFTRTFSWKAKAKPQKKFSGIEPRGELELSTRFSHSFRRFNSTSYHGY